MHLEVMADIFQNELGGEIRFLTPVQQLVQDDSGKVTGVIAIDNDGKVIQANASKGVIVCTGGYGANDEMLQDLCPAIPTGVRCETATPKPAMASAWRCGRAPSLKQEARP
ncbi:MAG: FAD-binding protein [Eggerthellaceae bacterium]